MNKCILNSIIALFCSGMIAVGSAQAATTFTCPTLHENQLYHYMDWIKQDGTKMHGGEWNKPDVWRLWIHGDTYLTPKHRAVHTFAMAAHYYPTTNTWYLKCISADYLVGPRNNVWTYNNCFILGDQSGFECN